MPQIVTIRSLPEAFNVIKEMQADGCEWGEDYRGAGREALAEIIQGRMREAIDRHLDEMARRGEADRRNGFYLRYLLTELGRIELCVPRTRRFNAIAVVRAYGRRAAHIDRMILACSAVQDVIQLPMNVPRGYNDRRSEVIWKMSSKTTGSMTARTYVVTYDPLSASYIERLRESIGCAFEQVVVPDIGGAIPIIRYFRGLAADTLYVPVVDGTAWGFWPVLKILCLLARAGRRMVINPDFLVWEFGILDGVYEALRAGGGILGGCVTLVQEWFRPGAQAAD